MTKPQTKIDAKYIIFSRSRSWWHKTRKPIDVIRIISVLVVAIALIFVEIRLYGTGFAGKTLWDWMQLLFVPAALAAFGFWLNNRERNAAERHADYEQKAAERHEEADREIALDNQRESA